MSNRRDASDPSGPTGHLLPGFAREEMIRPSAAERLEPAAETVAGGADRREGIVGTAGIAVRHTTRRRRRQRGHLRGGILAQRLEQRAVDLAGLRQAAIGLVVRGRRMCHRAVRAVDRAGVEAERVELRLHLADLRALQRPIVRRRGDGRLRRVGLR